MWYYIPDLYYTMGEPEFVLNITDNLSNVNIRALAIAAGWNQQDKISARFVGSNQTIAQILVTQSYPKDLDIYIGPGVVVGGKYIAPSGTQYYRPTDAIFVNATTTNPLGINITIENKGYMKAAGGTGIGGSWGGEVHYFRNNGQSANSEEFLYKNLQSAYETDAEEVIVSIPPVHGGANQGFKSPDGDQLAMWDGEDFFSAPANFFNTKDPTNRPYIDTTNANGRLGQTAGFNQQDAGWPVFGGWQVQPAFPCVFKNTGTAGNGGVWGVPGTSGNANWSYTHGSVPYGREYPTYTYDVGACVTNITDSGQLVNVRISSLGSWLGASTSGNVTIL